jgi:hypothetical protein
VHGLDRLFEVLSNGSAVSFSGLTLTDGFAAEYGSAIMNNSTATVRSARGQHAQQQPRRRDHSDEQHGVG